MSNTRWLFSRSQHFSCIFLLLFAGDFYVIVVIL